jgi:hypothetical protein
MVTFSTHPDALPPHSSKEIVQIVLQRLYLIERLHKPISTLLTLKINATLCAHLCDESLFCDFDHPAVQDCMLMIQDQGSLNPLALLWKSFSSYHSITDALLAQELTKAIYVVVQQLSTGDAYPRIGHQNDDSEKKIATMEERLNAIDNYVKRLPATHKSPIGSMTMAHTRYMPDVHFEVQAENVVERFYCIQRTAKIRLLIERITTHYPFLFANYSIEKKENGISIDGIMFTHPGIVEKITQIDQEHIPFIELSQDFERYKYIGDLAFTHGYLLTLFSACNHVLKEAQATADTKIKPVYAYDDMSNASLEQLLDAIDSIIDTLPDILEKYELNNMELTWKMWFRKYWWAPMFIGASIFLKLWIPLQGLAND